MGNRSLGSQLLIILILTLINGFFAAAEMAMVSVDRKKNKEGCKKRKQES